MKTSTHGDDEKKHLHSYEAHSEDEEYVKRFDGYKPKFEGIPEGYYPNTWGNIILILVLLGILYVFSAALFALLLYLLFLDTVAVSWVYAGIGFGYVCIIILFIFIGQTMRGKLEKKYMDEALASHSKGAAAAPNAI